MERKDIERFKSQFQPILEQGRRWFGKEIYDNHIIDILEYFGFSTEDEMSKCLAWLEKQGEKSNYNPYKVTVESIAAMVEKYAKGDLKDFYDNIKVKCKDAMEYEKTWFEKQGEQKSDKIEPKFKKD